MTLGLLSVPAFARFFEGWSVFPRLRQPSNGCTAAHGENQKKDIASPNTRTRLSRMIFSIHRCIVRTRVEAFLIFSFGIIHSHQEAPHPVRAWKLFGSVVSCQILRRQSLQRTFCSPQKTILCLRKFGCWTTAAGHISAVPAKHYLCRGHVLSLLGESRDFIDSGLSPVDELFFLFMKNIYLRDTFLRKRILLQRAPLF